MTGAKTQSTKRQRLLTADLRRWTQEEIPLGILPQRRRGRRELNFCLSGDDDKQKHYSIRVVSFCPIVVSRLGKRDFLSVLCVSAVRCPDPYLR